MGDVENPIDLIRVEAGSPSSKGVFAGSNVRILSRCTAGNVQSRVRCVRNWFAESIKHPVDLISSVTDEVLVENQMPVMVDRMTQWDFCLDCPDKGQHLFAGFDILPQFCQPWIAGADPSHVGLNIGVGVVDGVPGTMMELGSNNGTRMADEEQNTNVEVVGNAVQDHVRIDELDDHSRRANQIAERQMVRFEKSSRGLPTFKHLVKVL